MEIPGYEEFDQITSMQEYARSQVWDTGDYSHDTEVGFRDGQAYFIKDEEKGRGLVMPYVLTDTVAEEVGMDLDINYDEAAGKMIRPEIDGLPTDEYVSSFSDFFNKIVGRPLGPEPEEIYEAAALKYFIADSDVAPNIVVNDESAEPIDFQRAGNIGKHFYNAFINDLEEVFDHLNRDFSQNEFEDTVQGLTDPVELDELERKLDEGFERYDVGPERRIEAAKSKTLENFRRFA